MAGVALWLVCDFLTLPFLLTAGGTLGATLSTIGHSRIAPFLFAGPKLLALAWVGVEILRARSQLGVTTREIVELVGLPNVASHPAWSKPAFARLLSAEPRNPA